MTGRRVPAWSDLRQLVRFKTFYIAVVLVLAGVALLGVASWTDTESYRQLLMALGIALCTSSVVSLFSEAALRLDLVEFVIERLDGSRRTTDSGLLVPFVATRNELDCRQFATDAVGTLRILGLSANDILSAQPKEIIRVRLEKEPDFRVEILLLDPDSHLATLRSGAKPYSSPDSYFARTRTVLEEAKNLIRDVVKAGVAPDKCEMRLYHNWASLSMLADDRHAVVTPLVSVRTGGTSPFFRCGKAGVDSVLYAIYLDHFYDTWGQATPFSDLEP